ncbi:7-cyano-7-deazaguanine synthase [Avrilella dinanensis]|uniref:7-cyano-7-deazaguanine synthase n=1 Tax=Avrilella dinanensis TaxID=2008672 RepID=A0A2M9R530_9FLAO|nr:7-cyano-7-deazaguanine synthase [Avrilella dinanensis]PJR03863.1 hypothetical protein CDL10_04490 [Avrilella dinanensis]
MQQLKILWTGGWDSTFRILMLRKHNVTIVPYYVYFKGRKTNDDELAVICKIRDKIMTLPDTKASILDTVIFEESKKISKDIQQAFLNLRNESFLGAQYVQLSELALRIEDLELGIHKDDKAHKFIQEFGVLDKIKSEYGNVLILDKEKTSNKDVINLFGNFRFPLLNLTKVEMKKIAEKEGVLHIMNETIFCHHLIKNKPCGYCNPCIYTIQEGLSYRFGNLGLIRYYLSYPLKKILGKI